MSDHPILFSAPMVRAILDGRGGNEARRIHVDDQWVIRQFENGHTAAEIANDLGCSLHPIKKAMRRLGLRRAAKARPGMRAGKNNPAWKGGERSRNDGYVLVWTQEGERLKHRVVMEAVMGRRLEDNEIVHHIDGDKSNNNPDNLVVMTQSEHTSVHAVEMASARGGHKGEFNPRAKLTAAQVSLIKDSNMSSRRLGMDFGVNPSTIQRIRRGRGWI